MSEPTPAEIAYYEQHASDNKGPNIIVACGICLFLPVFTVMLRIIARRRAGAALGIDDYCIMLAIPAQFGYCISIILDVKYGLGRHIIFVKNPSKLAKALFGAETAYSIVIIFTKLSLLFLYNRLFPSKTLKRLSILIGSFVITCLGGIRYTCAGHLANTSERTLTRSSVTNVFADFCILALPVRFVLGLHLDNRRKYELLGIFALGGIVCIFGIVRCFTVSEASAQDISWAVSEGAIWSLVEISVGIVGACLPTLRPLFIHFPTAAESIHLSNSARAKQPANGVQRGSLIDLQNHTLWRDPSQESIVAETRDGKEDGDGPGERIPLADVKAAKAQSANLSDGGTPLVKVNTSHKNHDTPELLSPGIESILYERHHASHI
ncbi:MAG: hypothetical protein MMC33_008750 [Icmadophila ericetorum]|nr:hypothetical protein [Icmadophila ericetorum]